jgi:hypothetical protein
MKRIFLFGLLMIFSIGLPVATVQAQQLDPGCSSEMWGYMKDQADLIRSRNKAYEREILHRQQSTLYLTCFDQSMAVSAKLGLIFSDQINPAPPPANTTVFPNLTYADWGASLPTMAMNLDTIFDTNPPAEFNNYLIGGPPPIASPARFNFLPEWHENDNQLTLVAQAQQLILTQIMGWLAGDQAQAQSYTAAVTAINQFINALPTTPLQGLPQENIAYTTVLIPGLQQLVTTITTARGSIGGPLIAALAGAVTDFQDTCTRADDLWDKVDPAYGPVYPDPATEPGVFYPPEGQYYTFTPYYTLKDLLSRNQQLQEPWHNAPDTVDFTQELSNATDSAALKQALQDVGDETVQNMQNAKEPLGKIGNSPLWPQVPPLGTPNPPSAAGVIQNM